MSDFEKNRRRAVRRKRNLIAKELRENKLYASKVIEKKRTRTKVRIQDVDKLLEEDEDDMF